jgi:hypothetical protein
VIVRVRDYGAGDLDDKVDRGGEVPGMDVQIDHGDRRGVGDGVAERAFHRSSQVGVREHLLGPKNRFSPELDGVTFDQITGPSWVRPAGFEALHHADRGPDRACEVTQQVAGGPAGARRGALPVGVDDLGEDGGEEVESLAEQLCGATAHRRPPVHACG